MQWRMDLTRHLVACAPFGGPIAAIRKWEIMQLYDESARRTLQIFNSAGVSLASVVWDRPGGSIVGMSWTDDLTLVCVVQDGTVYRYNVHVEPIDPPISMGKECFQQSLADCVFWGNGMLCITESSQLFCISDFKNPKLTKLADLPILESKPVCIAAIDPQYVSEGNVEVLLGVGDYVLQVDEEEVVQLGLGIGKLQKIAISQNGTMVASFSDDGRLLVTNIDFSKILLENPCELDHPPDQLVWCGKGSVLLCWDGLLLMVGPYEHSVQYIYDEPVILIPECDGVRVLSNSTMEFLHRVPDSTVSIFKIGSMEPAALLYDALDHFDRRSAKLWNG